MKLNEYQEKAMTTCMASCENLSYMLMNLCAEVGELAGKVAKNIRKSKAAIEDNHYVYNSICSADEIAESEEAIRKEAGDVLWQLSGLCNVMGWKLEDVAIENLEKLASRKKRGVIDGNGDNR